MPRCPCPLLAKTAVGGSALLLLGNPRQTLDIDYTTDPHPREQQGLETALNQLIVPYHLDIKAVPIAKFVPLPPGSETQRRFVGRFGQIDVFLYGRDWRTVRTANNSRIRLFTYRTGSRTGPALLQVGRTLDDQDRVLGLFLTGLILLGSIVFIVFSLGGWLLSGRTIGPAQKAWDQQQAFVANASHELRTPLTILRATAELHLRLPEANQPSERFQSILDECDYMNRLVDDLLLLSRLDSHRLVFQREPIMLAEFLYEAQEQVLPLAEKKGITLVLGKSEGTILGDPIRMRQVLLILLDNALRYTPVGGKIQLEASQKAKQVTICVVDTGVGVPAEHLPHLFERFYQVPRSNIGEGKNNGLGLSIANALVEAQGGKITLQSQEGIGTQVFLTFSAAASH